METTNAPASTKPLVRLVLVLIGAVFWSGFAALGWGGFRPMFAHPPLIALMAVMVVLVIAGFFAGGNVSSGVREDRGNRWVVWVVSVISLTLGYVPALTDRLGFYTVDIDTVRWVGVALFAVGGAVRLWPVHVLGHRFSGLVAIQPGHELVTDGIYGVIRNPSYLGLLMNSVGWALAFRSIPGVVLAALLIPPLVARMQAEERLLADQFGTQYAAYRSRTWRLIPWLY